MLLARGTLPCVAVTGFEAATQLPGADASRFLWRRKGGSGDDGAPAHRGGNLGIPISSDVLVAKRGWALE